MKKIFFSLALVCICQAPYPQLSFLALTNPNRMKRVKVHPGDSIGIRFRGTKEIYRGRMTKVSGDTMWLNEYPIHPDELDMVIWVHPNHKRISEMAGRIRQVGFTVVQLVYFLNVRVNDKTIGTGLKSAGITLMTFLAALLVAQTKSRKFRVRKNWQLQVMELR